MSTLYIKNFSINRRALQLHEYSYNPAIKIASMASKFAFKQFKIVVATHVPLFDTMP